MHANTVKLNKTFFIILFFSLPIAVVSNTTCFFVSKSYLNLDFKGNLQLSLFFFGSVFHNLFDTTYYYMFFLLFTPANAPFRQRFTFLSVYVLTYIFSIHVTAFRLFLSHNFCHIIFAVVFYLKFIFYQSYFLPSLR